MGDSAVVGRLRGAVCTALARTVRTHRRREHLRPGTVGALAVRTAHRTRAYAGAIHDCVDADDGRPVCRGAVLARLTSSVAASRDPRRCHGAAAVRAAPGAARPLFGRGAAHLPPRCRSARRYARPGIAVRRTRRDVERRQLHGALAVLPDLSPQDADRRLPVPRVPAEDFGDPPLRNARRPDHAQRGATAGCRARGAPGPGRTLLRETLTPRLRRHRLRPGPTAAPRFRHEGVPPSPRRNRRTVRVVPQWAVGSRQWAVKNSVTNRNTRHLRGLPVYGRLPTAHCRLLAVASGFSRKIGIH